MEGTSLSLPLTLPLFRSHSDGQLRLGLYIWLISLHTHTHIRNNHYHMDDYYIIWTVTALICNINVVVDSTMPRTILFTCVGTPNVGEVQGIWCKGASWWGNTPLTLLGAREIPVVIMAANSAPVHRLGTIININIIVVTLHCPALASSFTSPT